MSSDDMVRTRRKRGSGVAKRVADPNLPACASWPTPEDRSYEGMWAWQGGLCGICGDKTNRALDEDHDHDTGMVRGLLCRSCNLREGHGTDAPRFVAWRNGVNSAGILGFEVEYVNPFTGMTESQARAQREALLGPSATPEQMRAVVMAVSSDEPTPTVDELARDMADRMRRAMMAAS